MLLSDLMSTIEYTVQDPGKDQRSACSDAEISSITRDSRLSSYGSLFVCVKGAATDGHDFALQAYSSGCRAFLAEHRLELPDDATVFITEDTRASLALLSDAFYGHPSSKLKVIGITGTKGKTTTALIACRILNSCGVSAGYIGSNGVEFGNYSYKTANTTPESCDLQRYMKMMVDAGVKYLVMEVSSQAIFLDRVKGVKFDTCAFTNLSVDHIGGIEHPTFEHYRDCKRRLFTDFGAGRVIYNADDEYAEYMVGSVPDGTDLVSCSCKNPADFAAGNIKKTKSGDRLAVSFELMHGRDSLPVTVPMPGGFTASNALLAAAICVYAGIPIFRIAESLSDVSIKGRFETVDVMPGCVFIIDYAHNGISLSSSLRAIREYSPKRIICLFGSVGGRTELRRKELGDAAAKLADFCILTSDNPDYEPPERIIDDIALSFDAEGSCDYVKIPDRREAIRYAVSIARPGDVVLLAGKGHEDYQLICGKNEPFSERAILLEAAGELARK